jgi:hypothetical protein
VFDECHKDKNLMPVKNPRERIVYASATGASEPKHISYMVRLGLLAKVLTLARSRSFPKLLRGEELRS